MGEQNNLTTLAKRLRPLMKFAAQEVIGASNGVRLTILTFPGGLSIEDNPLRIYNQLGVSQTISEIFLTVGTAPTGANLIVDVHKNGTTIFTTQTNRPVIAAGANTGNSTLIDDPVWEDGEYLTAHIDQVGSTGNGSDLVVHIIHQGGGGIGGALADHDHSGDAGDGGAFDAANLESGSAYDGDILTADGTGGAAWETPAAIPSALDDLTDVNAPAPDDQNALIWDEATGKWIAKAPPAGGTVDAADVTYTPAVNTDWDGDADPGNADNAFDQLAERVDDLEAGGGGGGRTLIEELTPTGTGTASFTSIPNTYKKLVIEFAIRSSNASTAVYGYLNFNADATAGNYGYSEIYNYGVTTGANGASGSTIFSTGINGDSSPAGEFTLGIMEFIQYANTNIKKHCRYHGTHKRDSSSLYVINYSSSTYWLSNTAINQIDIILQSGNFMANSVLRLYGEN